MTYRIKAYREQGDGWRQTAVRGIADDRADGPDTALILAAEEIAEYNQRVGPATRIHYDALVCEGVETTMDSDIEFLAKQCSQEMI